jgi:hypothetical protein
MNVKLPGVVWVSTKHVPTDAVGSRAKRLEADPHCAAADLRVALIAPIHNFITPIESIIMANVPSVRSI